MAEEASHMPGPLEGIRVVELAGLGPAPFAATLLADMGADVVRVDRAGGGGPLLPAATDVLGRGRRSIAVDLKHDDGPALVLELADRADVLLEGFRPGVTERLGLGPDDVHERNPGLVYGRMTGWGQDGPLADRAGHDLNYLAIAGALHPIGPADRPPSVPLNYVADFGGGGAFLAFGVACALLERERSSGLGQVVDAAMVDGTAMLTAMFHGLHAAGAWTTQREANLLDGGAPFYRCYRCADGGFVAVAALEPQFHTELLDVLELPAEDWPQYDTSRWPDQAVELARIFATRSRDEWAERFADRDACVTPVLSLTEAPSHPHLRERGVFMEHEGLRQPAPAPRLSRTPGALGRPPVLPGQHTDEVLGELGYSPADVADARSTGLVG